MTPRELVKVKELEWRSGGTYEYTFPRRYEYQRIGHKYFATYLPTMQFLDNEGYATDSEARAACQAHYENSIYEQLEPISFINRGDAVSPTP